MQPQPQSQLQSQSNPHFQSHLQQETNTTQIISLNTNTIANASNNGNNGNVEQFILTNNQRKNIIDWILKEFKIGKKQMPLQISVCYQGIQRSKGEEDDKGKEGRDPREGRDGRDWGTGDMPIQYRIPGSKYKHKTKTSNLITKLEQFSKSQQLKSNTQCSSSQPLNQTSPSSSPFHEDSASSSPNPQLPLLSGPSFGPNPTVAQLAVPQVELPESTFRYFNTTILCYRCSKPGHYKSVCPQPSRCVFCLSSEHDGEMCEQKQVCYRCYRFGHVIAQCGDRDGKDGGNGKCEKCQKYHEGRGGCWFLNMGMGRKGDSRADAKRRDFYQQIYRDQQVQCIRCFEYGHLEC